MLVKKIRNSVTTFLGIASLCLLWAVPVSAQDNAPQLLRVIEVELNRGMAQNFRAGHRDVITPKNRELGVPFRYVANRVLGDTNIVQLIRPIPNLAAINMNLGLSEMEQTYLSEVMRDTVDARRQYVMQLRPEMSLPNIGFGGYTVVYRLLVKGDRVADFMELWVDEVIPAFNATGIQGTQVYQTVQGGNLNEFFTATPVPALPTGTGGGGPFAGLGPQGAAALNQRISEMTESLEIYWDRVDGELSYGLTPPN